MKNDTTGINGYQCPKCEGSDRDLLLRHECKKTDQSKERKTNEAKPEKKD